MLAAGRATLAWCILAWCILAWPRLGGVVVGKGEGGAVSKQAPMRDSGECLRRATCLAGLLVDEPGGYKALVFDQSDRITEPISAADVADICLRALHEGSARNKVRFTAAQRMAWQQCRACTHTRTCTRTSPICD